MTARNISEHNIKWICPSHLISVGPIGAFLTLKCQMSNVKLLKTVNNHTSSWLFTTTLQVVGLVEEHERPGTRTRKGPALRPAPRAPVRHVLPLLLGELRQSGPRCGRGLCE